MLPRNQILLTGLASHNVITLELWQIHFQRPQYATSDKTLELMLSNKGYTLQSSVQTVIQ
eukprot:m.1020968 g.1020968  ORF g.1020968 m.1020968 type:complete len:60 (+) comp24094_c0_seq6:3480-3659(+)